MQTRFVGAGAAILLIATVASGLYLGLETRDRFARIDQSWQTYETEADRRGALLSRLRGHLGYGGIIHNFKNYVLRRDQTYLDSVNVQFADFKLAVEGFRALDLGAIERDALTVIERTLLDYEGKLAIAQQAAREGWPAERTDQLVRVDDRGALAALDLIAADWRGRREQSSLGIQRAVNEGRDLIDLGLFFLAALALVALLLYGLFYLLIRELRGTVDRLTEELHERRVAQHAARKFFAAVDQSPATIIITGTDGRIEYVNDKFSEVSGFTASETIGETPRFLQSGETTESAYLELRRRIARGQPWRGIFKNRKKQGGTYLAETVILPLRDVDGSITHFIGIGEDITEKSLAREQIQKAQKMEAVGLLASGVAHDFNNVLTTILGNVHLALVETQSDDPRRDELEQIDIAAKRARHMVREILTFARRQPGQPLDIEILGVVQEVLRLLRASTPANIELSCNIEDETLSVRADPTRLHQVLMNLCANAAEAIGTEPGRIDISIYRRTGHEGLLGGTSANGALAEAKHVVICISDNGPGIPSDVREQVFEPFFTTKPAGKGTGLGLAVVANLVGEMRGQIRLRDNDSRGTRFEISLLEVANESHAPIALPQPAGAESDRPLILLVDDEKDVLSTCERILRSLDYDVACFSDPLAAIDAFEAEPEHFSLVMTDLVMPNLNGEQVATAVRAQSTDCPILLFSSFRPGTLDEAALAPIRVIEKPIDTRLLDAALKDLLARPTAAQPAPQPAP